MGLFDGVAKAFQNALANEELPPTGPDGLSQDPWLKGVRKAITVYFVKDGEVVGQGDALPGDLLNAVASRYMDTVAMKTDQADLQVQSKTARIPAPSRRNMISDEALRDGEELLETVRSRSVCSRVDQLRVTWGGEDGQGEEGGVLGVSELRWEEGAAW
eukprot:752347-Hanusia_phi.AAC.1